MKLLLKYAKLCVGAATLGVLVATYIAEPKVREVAGHVLGQGNVSRVAIEYYKTEESQQLATTLNAAIVAINELAQREAARDIVSKAFNRPWKVWLVVGAAFSVLLIDLSLFILERREAKSPTRL